jgi:hypothetical protein
MVMILLSVERLLPLLELGIVELHLNLVFLFIISFIGLFKILLGLQRYYFRALDAIIIILLMVFFVVMVLSRNIVESGHLAMHGIFIPVLYYFSIKLIIKNEREYQLIIKALIIGIVILSISVIVVFMTTFSRSSPLRIPGISAATLLFMAIPISHALSNKRQILSSIMSTVVIIGLIATLTRAYFVMLLLYLTIRKLIKRGYAFKLGFWIFATTLFLTIAISLSPGLFGLSMMWM